MNLKEVSIVQDPIIRVDKVDKFFGLISALNSISVDIQQGEFFTLVGPSGCGKTTLLRIIAGFETPTSGHVYINNRNMDNVPANKRPTNMVFQSYAVFPHMNVGENIAYGLKARKIRQAEIKLRVADALAMVNMSGYEERSSQALSGGQKQRVALARALILKPEVLLLDEPLSALDKQLRDQMQSELRHLQRAVGITFVLVTHDQEEALTMSDRIAVMFDGEVAQLSNPQQLYRRPTNRVVADFIGVMNFLEARNIQETARGIRVDVEGLGSTIIPNDQAPCGIAPNSKVGIRPEMLTLLDDDQQFVGRECKAEIVDVQYFGDMTYYEARLNGTEKVVTISMRNSSGRREHNIGSTARIGWNSDSILLLN